MEFKRAQKDFITLESAIEKIQRNTSTSYEWYPVKNRKGILIEVGGNSQNLKTYIPKFQEGKYVIYENGYMTHEYSISDNGVIEFPTFQDIHNKNRKKYLSFINYTDFSRYYPKVKEIETIEYSTSYSVKL